MELTAFLDCVRREEIPPTPPDGLSLGGFESYASFLNSERRLSNLMECSVARKKCTDLGMWAIVDMVWTKQLAKWIGKRRVLEIMAGCGWLAKALRLHGVDIIATDKGKNGYHKFVPVSKVLKIGALAATRKFGEDRDVLIVSWSPYTSNAVCCAAEQWGPDRPIIYIGEEIGGCTAPDEFWEHFKEAGGAPSFSFVSWIGLHDKILIGHYRR